ncbi:MAG: hypothetical protein LBH63_03850, partial [Clostridiales Family XIII bacterium]|nr:hypothetical protein [Clostridiales Family XIII bacterium]
MGKRFALTMKLNACEERGFVPGRKARGLLVLLVAIAFLVAFAALSIAPMSRVFAAQGELSPLNLIESYPQNEGKHMPVQNVGIKLFFDGNVTAEGVRNNNSKCFKLTDSAGKKIKTEAYYGTKREDYILVTALPDDGSLQPDSEYALTISEALSSSDSRVLGESKVIRFTTVDTTGNTQVYMILMGVMVAGMIAMTMISNRRKARAEAEAVMKEGKVNPYKLAKDKGITLQQALAIIEKDKEKRAKRLSRSAASTKEDPEVEEEKPDTKRVKG